MSIQPIRIPGGWKVDVNTLPETQPTEATIEAFTGSSLLMLSHADANLIIDVFWRPEYDPNGNFELKLIPRLEEYNERSGDLEGTGYWENAIETFETRDITVLIAKVEMLLLTAKAYPDPRMLIKRGVVDKVSEALRQEYLETGLTEYLFENIVTKGSVQLQRLMVESAQITIPMLEILTTEGKNKAVKNMAKQQLQKVLRGK